jgi:YHS domain-containing protein
METTKILDPICDMIVSVEEARDQGLTLEYPDREYAFCSASCQAKFAKNSKAYIPKVEAWLAQARAGTHVDGGGESHAHAAGAEPQIDEGIRAWYKSCRCCLSDAYPRVVEALDSERAAMQQTAADAGICETAEAHETKTP